MSIKNFIIAIIMLIVLITLVLTLGCSSPMHYKIVCVNIQGEMVIQDSVMIDSIAFQSPYYCQVLPDKIINYTTNKHKYIWFGEYSGEDLIWHKVFYKDTVDIITEL